MKAEAINSKCNITYQITSQTNRRHLKAVLQLMLVTSSFVISFIPLIIFILGIFGNKLFVSL